MIATSTVECLDTAPTRQTALILRCCGQQGESFDNFRWPLRVGAQVEAPDWDPDFARHRGHGLSGWLYGEGNAKKANREHLHEGLWLVVEAARHEVIVIDGECKFPRATVRFVGSKQDAAAYLIANEPNARDRSVIGSVVHCGDFGKASAGYTGEAIAGYGGTAIAGDWGIATADAYGRAVTGDFGNATAGDFGAAVVGDFGTACAGKFGIATAEWHSTATAGIFGAVSAGHQGTLQIYWYDHQHERCRIAVAYVGENGIEPNKVYRLDNEQRFIEAELKDINITSNNNAMTYSNVSIGATVTAHFGGSAAANDYGTAIASKHGTFNDCVVIAGQKGILQINWYDEKSRRHRIATAYVGENGILPNLPYCLNDDQQFVRAGR
jgi:hypothetical protein